MRFREHLTYSNVMATIAVFVAMGGGAIAATAKKNSVTSKSIKPGNVTASDLAGVHAVTSAPIQSLDGGTAATATCPDGEKLVGGGAKGFPTLPSAKVALESSYPSGNSWLVYQANGGAEGTVSAYALCLKVKPGA